MQLNPFTMFRRKQVFSRAAVRHACQIDCELMMTDSMAGYDGRLIDISAGGAMFRPRLAYLMFRRAVPIELRIGKIVLTGEIVTTNQAGFGIRFETMLDDSVVDAVLAAQRDERLAA